MVLGSFADPYSVPRRSTQGCSFLSSKLLYRCKSSCAGKDFHGLFIIIVHDLFSFPEVMLKNNKSISIAIFSVCEFQ